MYHVFYHVLSLSSTILIHSPAGGSMDPPELPALLGSSIVSIVWFHHPKWTPFRLLPDSAQPPTASLATGRSRLTGMTQMDL